MKTCITLAAILVVLTSLVATGASDPVPKRSYSYVCPNIQCLLSDCTVDRDCNAGKKCCNGCCAVPVKETSTPGKCPNIHCFVSDCNVDKDCRYGMKCCNGCCAQPI